METLDYWRFCSELTVVQAALLIIGVDPTPHFAYISAWKPEEQPKNYAPVFEALKNDILAGRLAAKTQPRSYEHSVEVGDNTDWDCSLVAVHDLKVWLANLGVTTGFFFPEEPVKPEYLDKENDSFAPKLAAAVLAWKAVRAERVLKPSARTVKQDLQRWLNLHAATLGLTNDEGELNNTAIEEAAKVANWDTKGGAPKTPGN